MEKLIFRDSTDTLLEVSTTNPLPVTYPQGLQVVYKTTASLPQSTAAPLFTIAGGRIRVVGIYGEVTTVIQTQANNTKLIANPTVGADVDLCAVNDITGDAVGTIYSITGTLANAMVATTSGAVTNQANDVLVAAGTIDLSCAASSTGATKWVLQYIPIDLGVTVS